MSRAGRKAGVLLLLPCAANVFAAGGHHGIDDAAILSAGQCEQETWFSRARGGARLVHAGLGCGVGPVEVGAAVEHERFDAGSGTAWNMEVKWARALGHGWSIGASLQPLWQAHQRPRFAATQFTAMATYFPRDDVALHVNAGRDFVRHGDDLPRGGVAAEWSPATDWWLLAERYVEQGTHFARAGARWSPRPGWSVDLSRAQRLAGPAPSNWTLGVTFSFDPD